MAIDDGSPITGGSPIIDRSRSSCLIPFSLDPGLDVYRKVYRVHGELRGEPGELIS
jgi:hypothetical protein